MPFFQNSIHCFKFDQNLKTNKKPQTLLNRAVNNLQSKDYILQPTKLFGLSPNSFPFFLFAENATILVPGGTEVFTSFLFSTLHKDQNLSIPMASRAVFPFAFSPHGSIRWSPMQGSSQLTSEAWTTTYHPQVPWRYGEFWRQFMEPVLYSRSWAWFTSLNALW